MNSSETLYTPIQINGCISDNELNATELYPRELYITKEGRLIVGNPKSTNQKALTTSLSGLTVDTSLKSKAVNYSSGASKLDTDNNLIKGFIIESAYITSATLGRSSIELGSNATLQFDLDDGRIMNGTISNSNLMSLKSLNLQTYDSTLKIGSWGHTLPQNPSKGDVFILI